MMTFYSLVRFLILLVLASTYLHAADIQPAVIKQAGKFSSPNGTCLASLEARDQGGFLVLTFPSGSNYKVLDVTGIAWASDKVLIYSASPLYGLPGIYLYSCGSRKIKRLVAPRTVNNAYPDGADYFELQRISLTTPTVIYFYYAPDVDKEEFKNFRSASHLFEVHLDGTGFKKAQDFPR
jgi:hypothetical protein